MAPDATEPLPVTWSALERETLFGNAKANDDRATRAVVIRCISAPAYSNKPTTMK